MDHTCVQVCSQLGPELRLWSVGSALLGVCRHSQAFGMPQIATASASLRVDHYFPVKEVRASTISDLPSRKNRDKVVPLHRLIGQTLF